MTAPQTVDLNGDWTLIYGPQNHAAPAVPGELAGSGWSSVPARVPGNVEIDLMRAGLLPDLAVGHNIYLTREMETWRWWYVRDFYAPAPEPGLPSHLVLEGVDCIAQVFVNDQPVGTCANMFVDHRIDVGPALRTDGGPNSLAVRIDSAVLAGREHTPEPLEGAFATSWESLAVRKAPHMYGWDIMPRLVSAGLWRSVRLEMAAPTRWREVYFTTAALDPDQRRASLLIDWTFDTRERSVEGWRLQLSLSRDGIVAHSSEIPVLGNHGRQRLDVSNVDLWWPRGSGDAALYELTLELRNAGGEVVAIHSERVGIRSVVLERTEITSPSSLGEFVFIVNGERIFARGTNWVPVDALHSRDADLLPEAVSMLADLNCNMVRCWGGNVIEDHAFFDYCDAEGIMVWQDFSYACAIYPQTDAFAEVVRTETEAIVRKLRNHASLAVWSGNNEIDEAFAGWFGASTDPNLDRLSRQTIPAALRRLDPIRPYLPSSPYRGPELMAAGGHGDLKPEDHLWGPRDDFKGRYYTSSPAHFVSEIGYHGCPDRASLEQMMTPGAVWPWQDNDEWITHATRPHREQHDFDYRIKLMADQTAVLFATPPTDLDDFIFASQLSQAEALKFFIERFRMGKWRRTGILWWNVRDGWPIISDAIVDYYGRRKLAYEVVRRIQQNVCIMLGEPSDGMQTIVAANDTRGDVAGRLKIEDVASGDVLVDDEFTAEASSSVEIGEVPASRIAGLRSIRWSVGGTERQNHYLAGPRPFRVADVREWYAAVGMRKE